MHRRPDSHKGENGKVAVIGGSPHMHGAPIMSALAAEASGVDLVYIALPRCHAETAKAASLNLQVRPFAGDELLDREREPLLELLATMDSAVLGPGIEHGATRSIEALLDIIAEAPCALVLDAAALQPETLSRAAGKQAVLTPHLAELERMEIEPEKLAPSARASGTVIFLKGPVDRIAMPDGSEREIEGGNAGLTVGGTGDVLAGLIAGLIAQGWTPPEAAVTSGRILKRAAERLEPQYGYAFGARRILDEIPRVLREVS